MPLDGLYHEPEPDRLVQGVTANTVAAPTDSLYIVIPSFDSTQKWGPVAWTPHGNTYPTAGTTCLLAKDDQGLWWCLQWVGGWS